MTPHRKKVLRAKALEIIAQEAHHLADCADFDEVSVDEEEDGYLREQLKLWGDILCVTSSSVGKVRRSRG